MTKAGNDKYNNVNMKTFLKWIISTIYLITMTHDYDIKSANYEILFHDYDVFFLCGRNVLP